MWAISPQSLTISPFSSAFHNYLIFLARNFEQNQNFHFNSNPTFVIVILLHIQFLWDSAHSLFVSFAFGEMSPQNFCVSITYSSTSFLKGFVSAFHTVLSTIKSFSVAFHICTILHILFSIFSDLSHLYRFVYLFSVALSVGFCLWIYCLLPYLNYNNTFHICYLTNIILTISTSFICINYFTHFYYIYVSLYHLNNSQYLAQYLFSQILFSDISILIITHCTGFTICLSFVHILHYSITFLFLFL